MDRVFLDANVLFSAAWSPAARVLDLWNLPRTDTILIASDHAIDEAYRNLPPAKHPALAALLHGLIAVETPLRQHWRPLHGVSLPDGDMAILQAAIFADATHLISGDRRHFGPLYECTVEGVLILPPSRYQRAGDHEATASRDDSRSG